MEPFDTYISMTNFFNNPSKNLFMGEVINGKMYPASSYWEGILDEYMDDKVDELDNIGKNIHDINENNNYVSNYVYSQFFGKKLNEVDLNRLKTIAEPAPYGNIMEQDTRIDTNIRNAFQITKDVVEKDTDDGRFLRELMPLNDKNNEIDVLQNTKKMFKGYDVSFEFNKILIYEEGGHFQEHRDTPKPNVVGSLVFIFDTEFTGGEFVLDGKTFEERDEFVFDGNTFEDRGKYFMFYPYIPHKVKKVQSGTRVSVTYYIKSKNEDVNVYTSKKDRFTTQNSIYFNNLCENVIKKLPVGFILKNRYSYSELNKKDLTFLKGFDYTFISLLNSKLNNKLKYEVVPVIVHKHETYDYNYSGDCSSKDKVYRFNNEDMKLISNNLYKDDCSLPFKPIKYENVNFYRIGFGKDSLIKSYEEQYIEFVGNESQLGYVNNIYFTIAVIFTN